MAATCRSVVAGVVVRGAGDDGPRLVPIDALSPTTLSLEMCVTILCERSMLSMVSGVWRCLVVGEFIVLPRAAGSVFSSSPPPLRTDALQTPYRAGRAWAFGARRTDVLGEGRPVPVLPLPCVTRTMDGVVSQLEFGLPDA